MLGRIVNLFYFSALQRAEIAEIWRFCSAGDMFICYFSALQRAEIAEIENVQVVLQPNDHFSALQRAEIAEIKMIDAYTFKLVEFQCSSTSRNC